MKQSHHPARVQAQMRGASLHRLLCQQPGQGMWLPSCSQHKQRWPSLSPSSPPALLTVISFGASYSSSSWHFLYSKPLNILRSPSRMVPCGVGSLQIPQKFPVTSKPSSLLSPSSASSQCPEIPEMCPSSRLSFSGLGLVFIHMDSSLYSLPCSPKEMEVADPTYRWVREKAGKVLEQAAANGLCYQRQELGRRGNGHARKEQLCRAGEG